MQDWYVKYIGAPYAERPEPPKSFNCGELARYVLLEELGIDVADIFANAAIIRECMGEFKNPSKFGLCPLAGGESPKEFDICFMARVKYADHVGVGVETVDGIMILHAIAGGVRLEKEAELHSAGYRVFKWYRHEGRPGVQDG